MQLDFLAVLLEIHHLLQPSAQAMNRKILPGASNVSLRSINPVSDFREIFHLLRRAGDIALLRLVAEEALTGCTNISSLAEPEFSNLVDDFTVALDEEYLTLELARELQGDDARVDTSQMVSQILHRTVEGTDRSTPMDVFCVTAVGLFNSALATALHLVSLTNEDQSEEFVSKARDLKYASEAQILARTALIYLRRASKVLYNDNTVYFPPRLGERVAKELRLCAAATTSVTWQDRSCSPDIVANIDMNIHDVDHNLDSYKKDGQQYRLHEAATILKTLVWTYRLIDLPDC